MNNQTTGTTYDNGNARVLWGVRSKRFYILVDGYGLGISDGYVVDRPIVYDDKRVAYSCPERLPKYVKRAFERLAAKGAIQNRMGV